MSKTTVLIVEDEFAIADLLDMALTDEGYHAAPTLTTCAHARE
jgi:DNA-binding response OmpR family regulator